MENFQRESWNVLETKVCVECLWNFNVHTYNVYLITLFSSYRALTITTTIFAFNLNLLVSQFWLIKLWLARTILKVSEKNLEKKLFYRFSLCLPLSSMSIDNRFVWIIALKRWLLEITFLVRFNHFNCFFRCYKPLTKQFILLNVKAEFPYKIHISTIHNSTISSKHFQFTLVRN